MNTRRTGKSPLTGVSEDRNYLPDSQRLSGSGRIWMLAVLSALMGFASISTDFYLPAMPAMAAALGTGPGTIEFTISGYLAGFSIGQLFWGPVSDRTGRRLPVAAGIVLFVVGSAGCALSDSAEIMIFWRIVQALGASAGVVLARAMVRDLYDGSRSAQMLSTLMVVMAIAPLAGPILGAQIAAVSSWRAIFWVLVAFGVATLIALFTIPETLPAVRRTSQPLSHAARRYIDLLAQPKILAYGGAGAFFYAGVFAYVAGTPFAFITYHKVPAGYYGLLFGTAVLGIMAANLVNTRLVQRYGITNCLKLGTVVAALSAIAGAIAAYTDIGGLWGLFLPLSVFISCNGFIIANSIAGALSDFPEEAGAISALVGAIQYGSGLLGSGLVGAFADGTPWPMGCVIGMAGIGSLICARLIGKDIQAQDKCTAGEI